MINYDTIISNFDDKVTLYNWLRKVEEALKNASATNFVVNKKGNATLSFSITFADGETLESGDIVLQQGESVDQARIASGILQLHLTNGTWLTAGNIKPVSNFNIDENQHLIVNYQDGTSQDLGAIFNGNVNIDGNFTANSIIENMNGYSFVPALSSGFSGTFVYCGAVKNGNKLTLVCAVKLTRNAGAGGFCQLGYFYIPSAVGAKLYPTLLPNGNDNVLDTRAIHCAYSTGTYKTATGYISKPSNNAVIMLLNNLGELVEGTEYYIRYEATFLLSDNLAQ